MALHSSDPTICFVVIRVAVAAVVVVGEQRRTAIAVTLVIDEEKKKLWFQLLMHEQIGER